MFTIKMKHMLQQFLISVFVVFFSLEVSKASRFACQNSGRRSQPALTSCFLNKKYLYFTHERVSYHTANCRCREQEAELATIKNEQVQDHIERNMPKYCHEQDQRGFYHIGLFKNETWVWSDGSDLNFTNWKMGPTRCREEPNGFISECFNDELFFQRSAQISACEKNSYLGKWYDKHENMSQWFYICQKSRNESCPMITTKQEQMTTPATRQIPTPKKEFVSEANKSKDLNKPVQISFSASKAAADLLRALQTKWNFELWENNLSYAFALELMKQNVTKISEKMNFPNIAIGLLKVSSKDELYQEVGKNNETSQELALSFYVNESNSVLVNSSQLEELKFPIAIVSAAFDSRLWTNTSLPSLSPLSSLNETAPDKNKLKLNKKFNVLATGSNVLSITAFTLDQTQKLEKRSVAVQPIFEIDSRRTLRTIEARSDRKAVVDDLSYKCVFLKKSVDLSWSDEGCYVAEVQNNIVRCSCNHTTSFGVMLAVRTIKVPDGIATLITVLQCVSILALIITTSLLLLLKKKIRNHRTVVQLNLATSLLFLHVFFVLGGLAPKFSPVFCKACAVLSNFFLLSSGFWMLNEGIVLYFRTYKKAISFNLKTMFPLLFALGWGAPLLLVSIVASIGLLSNTYMDRNMLYDEKENSIKNKKKVFQYDTCWVSVENNMIYSVVVPLIIILAITSCIVIKTAISISRMKKSMTKTMKPRGRHSTATESNSDKDKKSSRYFQRRRGVSSNVSVALRAVVLLLPVLGVPWLLGFMVNIRGSEEIFQVLHGLINGLQGVFIFFIYCVNNTQLRWAARRKWQEISFSPGVTDGFQSSTRLSRGFSRAQR